MHLDWPKLEMTATRIGGRDLLVLRGPEPDYRWRELSADLVELAKRLGVVSWVSLGAIPAAVPHTRPVPILATASAAGLLPEGIRQGPDGLLRVPSAALSVLELAVAASGIPAVGFFAQVPHYVNATLSVGLDRAAVSAGPTPRDRATRSASSPPAPSSGATCSMPPPPPTRTPRPTSSDSRFSSMRRACPRGTSSSPTSSASCGRGSRAVATRVARAARADLASTRANEAARESRLALLLLAALAARGNGLRASRGASRWRDGPGRPSGTRRLSAGPPHRRGCTSFALRRRKRIS